MMFNFSSGKSKITICLALTLTIGWVCVDIRPVQAQTLTGAFGNNKRNAAAPVRIEANLLEVLQNKKQAIFTGNVVATRGTVRLRSARLVVHYKQSRAGTPKSKTEITLLVARGNVIVTSGDKKATGQWAKMNMRTNKVTMGDKVILRENKNIIHGSKLELDLKTGKSRLSGSTTSRVRGVFVPDPAK